MSAKIKLQEQDYLAEANYLDARGDAWNMYPVGEGYRHSPCVVCGGTRYTRDFWQNLRTGDCAHNREKCAHVEPLAE